MAEPPIKRARRTDSAAMWDKNESMAASAPPRPSADSRDSKRKDSGRDVLNDTRDKRRNDERRDGRKRRSRSRERYHNRRERSRSREQPSKDKDRDRERERDRDRARYSRRDEDRERDRRYRDRRERERSPSSDRYRSSKAGVSTHRDREKPRRWSRSRSPARNGTGTPTRTRSPPKAPRSDRGPTSTSGSTGRKDPLPAPSKAEKARVPDDTMHVDSKTNGHPAADEDEDSEEAVIRKMMGFSTFKSTQNKKIPGNNVSGFRKEKSTKYRQYMNRTGGFNRPLSPSRE